MSVKGLGRFATVAVLLIAAGCTSGAVEVNEVSSAQEVAAAETVSATAAAGSSASLEDDVKQASAGNLQYFADDAGLAIRGADPVAYFVEGAAVPGSAEFSHDWGNVTWQFASAENRDLFAANPEQYAPQYGGFCAWAVSQGYTASIDPEAWQIVDGRLYLNYDRRVQQRWEQDIPGNIAKADANWPGVLDES